MSSDITASEQQTHKEKMQKQKEQVDAHIAAAETTWPIAKKLLNDETYDLIILDELTYILGYKYLERDKIINTIQSRPEEQSVVVTSRVGGKALREIMDTISEVKDIKHGYRDGIKARAWR